VARAAEAAALGSAAGALGRGHSSARSASAPFASGPQQPRAQGRSAHNAAVAIERIRKDADVQWSDLLGTGMPSTFDRPVWADPPKPRPSRPADQREWRKGSDEPSTGRTKAKKWFPKEPEFKAAIDAAMLGCVTAAETSFVLTLETMRRDYGINSFLSEKQAEWLMALSARARV
jgi:hypothetical protein